MLGLFLMESLPIRDPSRHELRELIGGHHADGVEVEVASIPARGLRMKDVGPRSGTHEAGFQKKRRCAPSVATFSGGGYRAPSPPTARCAVRGCSFRAGRRDARISRSETECAC